MPRIREDEFYAALQAVDDGVQSVHILGQPGVGKSTFLEQLEEELSEWYRTRVLYVREGNTPTTLSQDLLIEARDAAGTLSTLINKATGMSVGISPASAGVSTDDRARHLRKLASLSESVNEYKRLIFFVDDVHKLNEPEVTRDFLRELSSTLGENVHLITAGRLSFDDADYTVHLETFSREETANYFQEEHPDVDDETIDGVYEKLDGHPYYLGLLREAADDNGTFEIPKEDARDFIERAYLDSMSEAEEEFIRKTAGLGELDEDICSAVLDDVSRTHARRTLDSLSTKAVVQELGRSEDTGDRVFKVHDLFQEFLYEQLENPEKLHRAAFQYYAEKLYDEVEGSEAPMLEGFVYGLLGNAHLQEIYNGDPEVKQFREEIDRLEFEPHERLQFMFGYTPYAPTPEDQFATLLALELDDYTKWIRSLEPEDDGEEIKLEFVGVLLDLMRATVQPNTDVEFDDSSVEIYESTLQRVDDFDFVTFFDEDEQDTAQIIPDMLRLCVHVSAHRDLEEGEHDGGHLTAAYDVLERYGLNRVAVEGSIDNCRELAEEFEAGEQAEEMIEGQMEEFFGQFDQDDATRNTLIRMQSDLYSEMVELANSAFTAMISKSDRLLEFIHECGDSLEQADTPFFVAAWYSFAAHVYRMFAPNADSTRELEEAAQHYAEVCMEYEEDLDNPIYEIEEFEIYDMDFPDLMNEIASSDGDRHPTE